MNGSNEQGISARTDGVATDPVERDEDISSAADATDGESGHGRILAIVLALSAAALAGVSGLFGS